MTSNESSAREHIQPLIDAALEAADPASAIEAHLRRDGRRLLVARHTYDLDQGHVYLIAAGKAALPMSTAALEILGDDIWAGVIITKQAAEGASRRYVSSAGERRNNLAIFEAAHPVSDRNGVRATAAAIDLLQDTEPGDLVLCLLSGGASALLTQPLLPLGEWQQMIQALLESGCTINELNCVRKQLDSVKGGGLAAMAGPASTISLILSDVVGNPLDVIGSGPTVPNTESPGDALTVLHRYDIMHRVTPETWAVISEQLTDPRQVRSLTKVEELEVRNVIVGDVRRAATAAVEAARESGLRAELLTAHLQGEAREVGAVAAALARDLASGHAWVLGGETTVTVRGEGTGGRNQELALAAAVGIEGCERCVIATFATDGEDGPTDSAGAIVTGETVTAARTHNLDPQAFLDANDSYNFFTKLSHETGNDYLLHPGSTGTNVNDLLFILNPP